MHIRVKSPATILSSKQNSEPWHEVKARSIEHSCNEIDGKATVAGPAEPPNKRALEKEAAGDS